MRSVGDYVYEIDRSRNYQFRRYIRPVELMPYFGGQKYFTRSLGTSDLKLAKRIAYDWEIYTTRKLEEARAALARDPSSRNCELWADLHAVVTIVAAPVAPSIPAVEARAPIPRVAPKVFRQALAKWLERELERLEAAALDLHDVMGRVAVLDRRKRALKAELDLPLLLNGHPPKGTVDLLVGALAANGCAIEADDGLVRRYWRAFGRVVCEMARAEEELLLVQETDPSIVVARVREEAMSVLGLAGQTTAEPVLAPKTKAPATKVWRLDDLLTDYLSTYRGAPEAANDVRLYAKRFTEVNGNLPLNEFERSHVLAFHGALSSLPARLPAKHKVLTLPQIVEAYADSDKPRLAFKSLDKHHAMLSSAFRHANRVLRIIPANPFEGSNPVAPRFEPPTRRAMTPEELSVLFASPLFLGCASTRGPSYRAKPGSVVERDAFFWLPLVSLLTGARLEELSGLLPSDIIDHHGYPAFRISPFDDEGKVVKAIKNQSSVRIVPIPQRLLDLGFFTWARAQRGERLFAELQKSSRGRWAAKASKDFGKYFTHIGLSDPMIVFHSLRHSFKDALRDIGPSEEDSHRLMGHIVPGAHAAYGSAENMKRWRGILDRLEFPTVDFEAIKTASSCRPSPSTPRRLGSSASPA